MRKKDGLRDRIALMLWRDRDGYDPATGRVTKLDNVSLLTRLRIGCGRAVSWFAVHMGWLIPTLVAAAVTLLAARMAIDHDIAKAKQEVKADAGEILLKCRQDRQGVLTCRKAGP